MTRCVWQFALTCAAGLVLMTCALRPAYAQTGPVMCYDSTRAAYFPRPTRAGDTLVTAQRTATTVCAKPLRPPIFVRVGATDTIVTQPGAEISVPIIVEPGVGAFQATLTFATSRLTLTGPTGAARMQWVHPWTGAINPSTRTFNVLYVPPDTLASGPNVIATVARAYFTVRPTTGRTNISITAPTIALDGFGASVVSRVIVRGVVVCVVTC